MSAAIETHELRKQYGTHHALHGIDLRVEPGTVFGLVGPNGAGKTTFLRTLVDIIRPTSGTVQVLGLTPQVTRPALRRRIGYLPGELKLSARIRGGTLLRHLAQISGPVHSGRIEALAERLSVDLTRPLRALSKGNRQKLGLIQAFMHRPELLILDEPTSGLDPVAQREFLTMVREARTAGQTVVLSSHILSEIQQVADDVAVLAHGQIVAQGDVSALTLSTDCRMHAVLAGTTVERALSTLSALPDVADLRVEETGTGDLVRATAVVSGERDPIIKALATFAVRDLALEEPNLEEAVLRLYAKSGGTP